MTHFQTALSLCPAAIYIHTNLGVVHQQMGNFEQAEKAFRVVLRETPSELEARLNLGGLYRLRGQFDSAAVHYEQTLRINPALPPAHLNLAYTYTQQGRYQDALPHYERAAQTYSEDPNFQWGFGLTLQAVGRPTEAEAAFRKVIALQPGLAQAHLALGSLLYARKAFREALNAYRAFLSLSQSDTTNLRFAKERIALCEKMTGP